MSRWEVRHAPTVSTVGRPTVRASRGGLLFTGYAAVFNKRSENLGGFYEIMVPGAFRQLLASKPDVPFVTDHEPSAHHLLARTTSGTLTLREDRHGLRVSAKLPDTAIGRHVAEIVRRGDLPGMSFAFRIAKDGDRWSRDDNDHPVRHVHRISSLRDVSAVVWPAYPDTSAAVEPANDTPTGGRSVRGPSPTAVRRKLELLRQS